MTNREMNHKYQHLEPYFTKAKLKSALIILLVISVIIGFLTPFGMNVLPLHYSILYWLVTCSVGYMIYVPCIFYGNVFLKKFIPMQWFRIIFSGLVASVIISLVVPLLNELFFKHSASYSTQFWSVLPKAIVIGAIFNFIGLMENYLKWLKQELTKHQKINTEFQQQSEQGKNIALEQFMALLPIEKRGDLYCLEMADHYIKVYTSKGHHLLLMRFKDALTQLAEFDGLQTHRSWWVSKSAVNALKKEGRKVSLLLANELEVPVSRTYLNDVKSAGIH
ncbi:LytTR family transcriptional regulator [Psychrosphaera sp. F3M07]|uniref:LytTR family DNA-binding domain-containing protein n=1 Tax=Psychrosphaera sp. F3M07 TaxID=2841560 RepID=UPI001C0A04A5|nr:LytTR family DNA-binding domain-containing protein [Psychrosphaera sp. F3M07]MBU2918150.1 LytTR family transcriptional regulator [Psychrosphaera sp. F3M07]